MQQTDIILIDSESTAIDAISEICGPLVAGIDSAMDEASAIEQLARKHYGIAIVDVSICDSSGFKLYDYILKAHKSTRVLLRCRQTEVMEAISATRNGCFAFFQLTSMQVQLPHLVQAAAQIDQRRADYP